MAARRGNQAREAIGAREGWRWTGLRLTTAKQESKSSTDAPSTKPAISTAHGRLPRSAHAFLWSSTIVGKWRCTFIVCRSPLGSLRQLLVFLSDLEQCLPSDRVVHLLGMSPYLFGSIAPTLGVTHSNRPMSDLA